MSGISPISSPLPQPVSGSAGITKTSESKEQFGGLLKTCLQEADKTQQDAAGAIREVLAGNSEDMMPVISAVAKADLSFKLLLGVRNKMIEAYKQTMNMQL